MSRDKLRHRPPKDVIINLPRFQQDRARRRIRLACAARDARMLITRRAAHHENAVFAGDFILWPGLLEDLQYT